LDQRLKEINTENKRRLEEMKREIAQDRENIAQDRVDYESKLAKQMETLQHQMLELMGEPTGQPLSPIRKRLDSKVTPTKDNSARYNPTEIPPPGGYAATLPSHHYTHYMHPPSAQPYQPTAPPYLPAATPYLPANQHVQFSHNPFLDQENHPPTAPYPPAPPYTYRHDPQYHYQHPSAQTYQNQVNQETSHQTEGSSSDTTPQTC
jgi:hypothetical protein